MKQGRSLSTFKEIRKFLIDIDIKSMIDNREFKLPKNIVNEFYNRDVDDILNDIILKIYDAIIEPEQLANHNTYDDNEFRLKYIKNTDRKVFDTNVVKELLNNQVIDEIEVDSEHGGLLPTKNPSDVANDGLIFLLIGLPASGESTIARKISDRFKCLTLDCDIAKRKIPEFKARNGASLVHKESNEIINEIRNIAIEKNFNIIEPIIGSEYQEVETFIEKMKKEKYKVFLIHSDIEPELSVKRTIKRFIETGRYVPIDKIIDVYYTKTKETFRLVSSYKEIKCINIDTSKSNSFEELDDFLNKIVL